MGYLLPHVQRDTHRGTHFSSCAMVQPGGRSAFPVAVCSDGRRSIAWLAANWCKGVTPAIYLAGRGGADLDSLSPFHQPEHISSHRVRRLHFRRSDDCTGIRAWNNCASALKGRAGGLSTVGVDSTQRTPLRRIRHSLWHCTDWGCHYRQRVLSIDDARHIGRRRFC